MIYRSDHTCGYRYDFFAKADKSSLIVQCPRCNKQTSAHQVFDRTVTLKEKDGTIGVMRHDA